MKKFKGSAWNDGKHNSEGKGYGIRIGKKNRDLYFDENWKEIQLSIENDDYFKIKITDGFWRNCTEFRNQLIGQWLIKIGYSHWEKGKPPKFHLIKVKNNNFLLEKI